MQDFIVELKKVLAADQILSDPVDLELYETDATSLFKKEPGVVVIPKTVEEVSAVIKLINSYNTNLLQKLPEQGLRNDENRSLLKVNEDSRSERNADLGACRKDLINFVARGAGTGLSGGAIGEENSVIISLAAFDQILEVDIMNGTALVETGVVNQTLSERIKDTGLHFAPDPSSQKSATIGGNVAENAGGIHCYKYGVTSDHVLGLEIVLPNGEITWIGNGLKKALGPNLSNLITGSEGMFGIVTKALLKLTPIPESFLTMQVSFGSVRKAAELVADIVKHGFKPCALEMMDTLTIRAVDEAFDLGFRNNDGSLDINAVLLIELDGDEDEVILEAEKIRNLVHSYNPMRYEETQDTKVRDRLWKVRKGAVAAFGKIAPSWYLYDAVVPRSKIPDALDGIAKIAQKYNLALANVFHAGDGNLHPNFLYDIDKDPTVVDRIFHASHEVMELCIGMGGVLSGEHGIGLEKQEYMDFMFSKEDMAMMLSIRDIFDPHHISNPNKIFPTKICHEASHSHKLNQAVLG